MFHNIALFYLKNEDDINLDYIFKKADSLNRCMEILAVVRLINLIYSNIFPLYFVEQLEEKLNAEKYKKDLRIRYINSNTYNNINKYYRIIKAAAKRIYCKKPIAVGYNSSFKSDECIIDENSRIYFWHDKKSLNFKLVVFYHKKYPSEKPPSFKFIITDFKNEDENNKYLRNLYFYPDLDEGIVQYVVKHKNNYLLTEYLHKYDLTFNLDGYILKLKIPWQFINMNPKRGSRIFFDFIITFYSEDGKQKEKVVSLSNSKAVSPVTMQQFLLL